jgi:multicomponent Na+:H+ antiporter subunit E
LFFVAYVFWLLLTWPVSVQDGRLLTGDIVAGLFVAALVALVMREIIRKNYVRFLKPAPWFWGFVYLFVFGYYVIKGGVDVVYRVLHPAMPIRPGIVKMKTVLKTDTGRTALASSITLTPGTLTMDISDDGVFYIHWLYIQSLDEEQAARLVMRRFEWFIQRIFE